MTFLVRPRTPLYEAQLQARALDTRRDAELLVQVRWRTFLEAEGGSRPGAFAAYVAALDAEAVASIALADTHSVLAEAA
jgi:hypothetical protein